MQDVYLDHAATSHPKPECVIKGVVNALEYENANPGRSGHKRAIQASYRVMEARRAITELFCNEDEMEIVFTHNCTDALNLAIKGTVKAGDHVIASKLEHNSVLRVLGEKARRGEIEYTFIAPKKNGYISPADYLKAIRKNTSLMILTHASNVTGAVQPVEAVGAIAGSFHIPYLIDGAQAAGEISIDIARFKCDLYAFAGHKGLLGPQGTGGLYIKKGFRLDTLREGGTGSSSESIYQPEEVPERYEAGTMNLPGLMGLKEGAAYVMAHADEIRRKIRLLTDALYEGLKNIKGVTVYTPDNPVCRTGVVSFNVNDLSSQEAASYLDEYGFCVRSGLHCAPLAHEFCGTGARGMVRASVGWSNTMYEIDRFLERVYLLAKIQGPVH